MRTRTHTHKHMRTRTNKHMLSPQHVDIQTIGSYEWPHMILMRVLLLAWLCNHNLQFTVLWLEAAIACSAAFIPGSLPGHVRQGSDNALLAVPLFQDALQHEHAAR